jgi:hypothetical protein
MMHVSGSKVSVVQVVRWQLGINTLSDRTQDRVYRVDIVD